MNSQEGSVQQEEYTKENGHNNMVRGICPLLTFEINK